jgi:hypothetical protein
VLGLRMVDTGRGRASAGRRKGVEGASDPAAPSGAREGM